MNLYIYHSFNYGFTTTQVSQLFFFLQIIMFIEVIPVLAFVYTATVTQTAYFIHFISIVLSVSFILSHFSFLPSDLFQFPSVLYSCVCLQRVHIQKTNIDFQYIEEPQGV